MARLRRRLALATSTLTVMRVPVRGEVTAAELRASTVMYPLVGLAVATPPALALLLPLPPLPRAAVALAAWVGITGALHLDGWADCCDAAFAPPLGDPEQTRERRLAILKDPHVGTFGAVGLVLLLLGKWTALAHLSALAPLLAVSLSRWGMVLLLHVHPPARSQGLGAAFAGPLPLGIATMLAAGPVLAILWAADAPLRVAGAMAMGIVAIIGVGRFLAGRFGGITGDVCGAAGEAGELAVLWALLPWTAS